jgi:hypothetical protein
MVQAATSAGVLPVQVQALSPQRHELPGQSPLLRHPGTQVARVASHTWPSSHCKSLEQRPYVKQVPVVVSQKSEGSRQSAFFSQPLRS